MDVQHPDQHLDPEVACVYDDAHAARFDATAIEHEVDLLVELAGSGRALEFAIGTGRLALPLASRGVEIHGVELSRPMVDQLRAKPGGDLIPVTIGDMATTRVQGSFSLVFLVFNTINNLTSQDEQVRCFANAAAHLQPGGRFLIEVGVPDPPRRVDHERFRPFDVTDDHVGVDEYVDRTRQILVSHHVWPRREAKRRVSGRFRYVWPSELDLMARLAGLELEHRWADWRRSPFDDTSDAHVSVWRRPPPER